MKRREFITNAAGLSAMSLSVQAAKAQETVNAPGGFQSTGQAWPVRDTDAYTVYSKSVGDTMAVGVWQPPKRFLDARENPEAPLDVLYVLDASWAFGVSSTVCMLALADSIRPGFPPLMLVGVDYAVGDVNARSRDYTMPSSIPQDMAKKFASSPKTAIGGAEKFLAFLEGELDPFIRSNYNTTNNRAGLLGDSFGGTFAFYAFLNQSKLFDRYWIGSPGIFPTESDYAEQFEVLIASKLRHDAKMFLSLGSKEANGGVNIYEQTGRFYNQIVGSLNRFPNKQLTWAAKTYAGHTHTSVVIPAMSDALLYLYGSYQP